MKPTPFYFFTYTDERGKRVKTTYRLTWEQARERLDDPQAIEDTKEVRMCPDDDAEHQHTNVVR